MAYHGLKTKEKLPERNFKVVWNHGNAFQNSD
jgi:hypothetical protein